MDGDVVTPAGLDGFPQTMTSNNWWDGIGAEVGQVVNNAKRAAAAYTEVRKLVTSSENGNQPPGSFGLNPQASSVPGAKAQGGFSLSKLSPAALAALVIVAVLILRKVAK